MLETAIANFLQSAQEDFAKYGVMMILFAWALRQNQQDKKADEKRAEKREERLIADSQRREAQMLELNGKLQGTLERQGDLIEKQGRLLERQSKTLDVTSDKLTELTGIVGSIKDELRDTREQVQSLWEHVNK